jgi:hypothetical protein
MANGVQFLVEGGVVTAASPTIRNQSNHHRSQGTKTGESVGVSPQV